MTQATYGSFTVEGSGATPWSSEDDRRLRGETTVRRRDGSIAKLPPHVLTPSGLFFVGTVPPLAPGGVCSFCGAAKVHRRRCVETTMCFGCGRTQ